MNLEIKDLVQDELDMPSSLPIAMAARHWYESEWFKERIGSKIRGYFQPTSVTLLFARVQTTSRVFEQMLKDPTKIKDCYDEISIVSSIEEVEDKMSEDGSLYEIFNAENLARNMSKAANELFSPYAEDRVEKIAASINEAQRLAKQKGVDASQIYLNETYYKELVRRVYTPKDFQKIIVRLAGLNIEDLALKTGQAVIESLDPNLINNQELVLVLTKAINDQFPEKIGPYFAQLKEACIDSVGELTNRFWN